LITPRKLLASVVVAFGVVCVLAWPQIPDDAGAPLLSGAQISPSVRTLLDRSCRDCHSDATRYLWYAYVPPVSLLIASDVSRGRSHLNFSKWSEYPLLRRERALSEIANQVKDGGMPLTQYLWVHRDARLSPADREAIFQWTQQERLRLIMESASGQSNAR
jgi:Haem-binding domain